MGSFLHLHMHKKIYFNTTPLFLTTEITSEIEPYIDNPGTVIKKQFSPDAVSDLIREVQNPKTVAGVFIHNNIEELFEAFKSKFTLIQAAGGLVHTSNGNEILMIFRRGKWDLPKGKLDEGEQLEACAVREVEEETGLKYLNLEKPLCITYHTYHQDDEFVLKESFWYLMDTSKVQVLTPQTDEDIEKCVWISINQLAAYLENTHASIADVLKIATQHHLPRVTP